MEESLTAIQRAKGMQDVLPEDRRYWDMVIAKASELAQLYGFQRINLPILEYTDLYQRGVGEGSDFFVQKEMFNVEESDGVSLTLRPEFTAGFMRSYIQNGMSSWPQPVKLYTIGPAFRRERQQAGRYRQHSQFNCEILGETDPAADVEVMLLAMNFMRGLGFKGLTFQLNSTGCSSCKPAYIEKLTSYLSNYTDELADIDKERIKRNPLRVLDSKEPGMDELLADAPHIIDHLCEDCATHFADLCGLLDGLEQRYSVNFRLVRGIDYYTKTVFEVWAEGIGAQAAVFGGGRYDGLAEDIGGSSTPGVGFGSGIERIVLGMKEAGIEPPVPQQPTVLVAHFGGVTKEAAVQLAFTLRDAGIGTRLAFARNRRSMKSQMREANKHNIKTVLILGESEIEQQSVMLRPLDGGEQTLVKLSDIIDLLQKQS